MAIGLGAWPPDTLPPGQHASQDFVAVDELRALGILRRLSSVAAGRDYVAAYVDYVHFVEAVHRLAEKGAPHKHQEGE